VEVLRQGYFRRITSISLAAAFLFSPLTARAETLDAARQEYNAATQQAAGLQAKVDEHAHAAATLEEEIGHMNEQIANVSAQIADTQAKIADLKTQMAAKQAILNAAIKEQYVDPQPDGFAMVVTASSVGEIMDKQQYLEKTQDYISELLAEVQAAKKLLDVKSADLAKQQASLDAARAAKNTLLAQTRGEQARYEAMLKENKDARARLSQTIAKLSANGPLQSKGYVTRGTVIGREGSTGFSTGAHLHFSTYLSGSAVNPISYINSGQISWPLNDFVTTQNFGPAGWNNPVYSFHDGIDMDAGYGAPVMAACDGDIVMNSFQAGGFGHYILIDCGGGLQTLYGHMQ
jgi:septal ring factor EnvC (AmiA/AmiB activator)